MTQGADEGWSALDLTPSPRLLEILSDIPYQTWQCLAELIDNAFDDFLADDQRDPSDPPAVHVKPSRTLGAADFPSEVQDGRQGVHQSLNREHAMGQLLFRSCRAG